MKANYGKNRYDGAICIVTTNSLTKAKSNVLLKIRSIVFLCTELKFRRHKKIVPIRTLNKIYTSEPGTIYVLTITHKFKDLHVLASIPVKTKGIVIIVICKKPIYPLILINSKLILHYL